MEIEVNGKELKPTSKKPHPTKPSLQMKEGSAPIMN